MMEMALREKQACPGSRWERTKHHLGSRLRTSVRKFVVELRIIRRALIHPKVPWYAKLVVGCSVLYVASPIQLIPNYIPVIGPVDDVIVVSLGIKFLRRSVPKSVLDECERDSRTPFITTIPVKPVTDPLPNSKS
jgi:uncharacterized membrane protein YkvA (DUF1232 family)